MKQLVLSILVLTMGAFTINVGLNEPNEGAGVKVGEKAPTFQLKNVNGKIYSFENIMDANGNKPIGYIVIFTCNTCPVAQANEQRIIDLHTKYAPMGYPVVAIQPNSPEAKPGDNFEAMRKRAKDKGYEFVYLLDENQQVYPKYGASVTPEVFLVDKDLVVRYHGAIDDSARDPGSVSEKFLENAISAVEEGEDPKPAKTKAFGCGIKAKPI